MDFLKNKKIALLFPGQASQYFQMGKKLYEISSVYKKTFDNISNYIRDNFKDYIEVDLYDLINNEENKSKLDLTKYSQIAIFAVSISSFYFLREYIDFDNVITGAGHSLGEYTLLTAFNCIDLYDAVELVIKRGYFMYNYSKEGTMFAVIYDFTKESIDKLNQIVNNFNSVIANYNSYNQLIISCPLEVSENLKEEIKKEFLNIKIIPLKVSGAFHSYLVNNANELLKQEILKKQFNSPVKPIFLSIDGKEYSDGKTIKNLMLNQMVSSVNWILTVENIYQKYKDLDFSFLELLPNKVLTNIINKGFKNIDIKVYSLENLILDNVMLEWIN
mgnify:CR=1 FL=1